MLFRISLLLTAFISIIQVWRTSKLPVLFEKPLLLPNDYTAFTDNFKTLTLLIGLLLVLSVFWDSPKAATNPSGAHWIFSFALTLGVVAGLIAFVNPMGSFPWNERSSYVTLATRSIKPNLYAKLKQTPQIILLGSSVSFTTPADEFKNKWGVSAFNMALNGGNAADFVIMMNYIIAHSPDGKTPSTVLVEMVTPALKVNDIAPMPINIIPSVPAEQLHGAIGETVDSLLELTSLSDAIFTKLFLETGRWKIWLQFQADGTGVRDGEKTQAFYHGAVQKSVGILKSLIVCDQPDPIGKGYTETLIRLSHQYRFSLVFYRPPINDDFYKLSKTKRSRYAACAQKFDEYMQHLTATNENVFYKNLSDYAPISMGGKTVYIDGHHFEREGAILLINALGQEIEAALQWSRDHHK